MAKRKYEYALYKDDKFLALGTKEELAEYLGVKPETISFYRSKSYQKRTENSMRERFIVIKVDDEE